MYMAEIPVYTLSNISGETGIFDDINCSSTINSNSILSTSISSTSLSSNFISSNSISGGYLVLDYDAIPSIDPVSKGAVWRDSNNFLKISTG